MKKDFLDVLRSIDKNSESTQRQMAKDLGFSIGKINYCLKKLQEKGFIKMKSFQKNPNKFNYIYVLTPRGVKEKVKLTINFMKRIMNEYDELQQDLKKEKK
tara:strand:- start:650 stop:952 length:303 start_codon:yes stop_codon:yes gene_type:complete